MAQKHRNEVAVGLTVLVVLILTVYIVIALGDWSDLFIDKQHITVQLPYTEGLKGLDQGSPIFMGGVKIGAITKAWIDSPSTDTASSNDVNVFFIMEIPASYRLYENCILSSQSNVLGGAASLAIKDLGSQQPINDGDTVALDLEGSITEAIDNLRQQLDPDIPGSVMHQIKYQINAENNDSLMASLVETAANLNQITQKIDLEVTAADEKISLMTKVHTALNHLDEITQKINQQFDAEEKENVIAKIHAALDTLNHSLSQVDELIAANQQPITQTISDLQQTVGNITPFLEKATAGAESFETAMQNLETLTTDAREIITVNRDYLSTLVQNLHEISINLKMASREVRRAPWKLLYTPEEGELKIQGLIDAADDFASGAEQLDNAVLRLNTLISTASEQVPVDKKLIQTILSDLQTTFKKFQNAEQKFWKEIK